MTQNINASNTASTIGNDSSITKAEHSTVYRYILMQVEQAKQCKAQAENYMNTITKMHKFQANTSHYTDALNSAFKDKTRYYSLSSDEYSNIEKQAETLKSLGVNIEDYMTCVYEQPQNKKCYICQADSLVQMNQAVKQALEKEFGGIVILSEMQTYLNKEKANIEKKLKKDKNNSDLLKKLDEYNHKLDLINAAIPVEKQAASFSPAGHNAYFYLPDSIADIYSVCSDFSVKVPDGLKIDGSDNIVYTEIELRMWAGFMENAYDDVEAKINTQMLELQNYMGAYNSLCDGASSSISALNNTLSSISKRMY